MGLDMYLYAELYFGSYRYMRKENSSDLERSEVATYNNVMGTLGLNPMEFGENSSVNVQVLVAYWRKANHIHRWFVENTADGVDDQYPSYVLRENLEQLRDVCLKVAGHRFEWVEQADEFWQVFHPTPEMVQRARELLPTQGGFFFGTTEYDAWYFKEVYNTIKMLDKIIDHKGLERATFSYQASW